MIKYACVDHSPVRHTFKFENNFSTVGKSLPVKYCKILKIQLCIKVCEFCIHLYYGIGKVIENLQTSQDYIFRILQYIATKRGNCMKLRMLFPTVLVDIPNSKVV